MTNTLFSPLSFAHGPAMENRLMLAPLTNMQSHADGTLSEDEQRWLVRRAEGGFGLTMSCAAHVQESGQGFPGQLGILSDRHLPGLTRLASALNATGTVSAVQLQHSGSRALANRQAPWADEKRGVAALSTGAVEQLIEDFILAGLRAEKAGFHGVELHAAHGYLLCAFLDAEHNQRDDGYGGRFENRCRVLLAIIDGLRRRAGPQFQIGVRISPERYGIRVAEARALADILLSGGQIDYLDVSMWDVFKDPHDEADRTRRLLDYFVDLPRGATRLGMAGKLTTGGLVRAAMATGLDFVLIGRGAILHHDFPRLVQADPDFEPIALPVSRAYLQAQGLGPAFIDYMQTNWKDFVSA